LLYGLDWFGWKALATCDHSSGAKNPLIFRSHPISD
jgi:hypothetical protein